MTQGQFMNKTILFNTEMFEALLNGKKTVFVIPIESKKIKDETFVSYFHSEFTTFDTSYHTRFSLSHPFKIGDTVEIKEYRKKRSFLVEIKKFDVERLHKISRSIIWCEGIRVTCDGASLPMNLYDEYKKYWDSTNKKGYKYNDNPFVYICFFKLLKKEEIHKNRKLLISKEDFENTIFECGVVRQGNTTEKKHEKYN